jgi:hypothetical protein
MNKSSAIILGSLLIVGSVPRLPAQAPTPSAVPVDLEVPLAPTPVKADGKLHLAYELHVTNLRAPDLVLRRVEVFDAGGQASPLVRYEGADVQRRLGRPGLPNDTQNKARIGGGLRAVLFLWLTIEANAVMPRTLRHRLTFANGDTADETSVEGARIGVTVANVPVIGPPLRGDGWLAANGPADLSLEHRRALIVVDGKARIAQRFATDWVKFGSDGLFASDGKRNENWYGYGAEAAAVSDAVVAAVKDGIPENVPESLAVPITLDTIGGNYVSLDLGAGRFAFYGHLQPRSLRVKPGEKVRRGQVLGLVGNSGNSDAPHLHFQITDGASPLGSEGLPYEIDSFEVQGTGAGLRLRLNERASPRKAELPLMDAVVRF